MRTGLVLLGLAVTEASVLMSVVTILRCLETQRSLHWTVRLSISALLILIAISAALEWLVVGLKFAYSTYLLP
jgi:uncharacterized membrane protein